MIMGGKSTIVAMLKRYTRAEGGAVYAIKGCPMHEEPLHLIPDSLRPEIEREYGLYIEGDLCPVCRQELRDTYGGVAEAVPVERIGFSEKNRAGIGTFSPSDPKSQDITELTGSIDLARISEHGVESDPRTYRFDGELNIANCGLMEFIEMLKYITCSFYFWMVHVLRTKCRQMQDARGAIAPLRDWLRSPSGIRVSAQPLPDRPTVDRLPAGHRQGSGAATPDTSPGVPNFLPYNRKGGRDVVLSSGTQSRSAQKQAAAAW